jgi:hypothetical protein
MCILIGLIIIAHITIITPETILNPAYAQLKHGKRF